MKEMYCIMYKNREKLCILLSALVNMFFFLPNTKRFCYSFLSIIRFVNNIDFYKSIG